jgi:diguanylate cyclase (GGDEF)-like protein
MVDRAECRIVDQAALRMRVATFATGVWLTYVVCGCAELYVALSWRQPHRAALATVFGVGVIGGLVVSRLPREEIVRSRYREVFFFGWSMIDLALIVAAVCTDGGAGSPLVLVLFVPVVFAAMSYPLVSVIAVGGSSIAAYLAIALLQAGAPWSFELVFETMLACTCAMSAWQAANHVRQHQALMEVSRADPLTGCLNRRGFEEGAVAEIAAAARRARPCAVLLLDVDHFKEVNDRQGHSTGDELLRWVVQTMRSCVRPRDAIGRLGGDEFAVTLGEIEPAHAMEIAERMTRALARRAPCSVGLACFPMDGTDLEELVREADSRLYASRHDRPGHGRASASERLSWAATLARAVDMRMNAKHEHSRAVAECAVLIATALGWEEDMLGKLRIAAVLHDVGKVTVPDSVLCKPGRLTDEEFEVIKVHSTAGAELVSRIEGMATIVPWIRHSHESFDGSGYPDGLRGEAIPQASRIMLVADAFDAITSTRPYRRALSIEHACEELRRGASTQFDPACVRALLDRVSEDAFAHAD